MEKKTNCVCCNVESCGYNDEQCHCTAPEIVVGPQYCNCNAHCSDETVCATFFPKEAAK